MRRRRTIYHNDARHSYLWYFEPPMRLEDAWIPIDEVAGTAVDTFSYCVERGDGMFYPTKVGKMFSIEDGKAQSKHNYEWRAAACMLSLMERGLDPLQVLIDRAHEHGMDFIADLRLQRLGRMYPESEIENGGRKSESGTSSSTSCTSSSPSIRSKELSSISRPHSGRKSTFTSGTVARPKTPRP